MRPDPTLPRGTVHRLMIDSQVLVGMMSGEPPLREVDVYLPPGRTDGEGLPLLVHLTGFTGSGLMQSGWRSFEETVPERLDRLIAAGAIAPVAVAFPNCFTLYGGNQYVNSAAVGRWDDFLVQEMLPAVEARFGCGGPGKRGIYGKSSGGYGAIAHALLHGGEVWDAAACLSGDLAFELAYLPEMPAVLRALAKTGFDIGRWMTEFWAARKKSGKDTHALMTLAMAATYDPDPSAPWGIRLPVTMDTCTVIEDRWANWLAWDPVLMAGDPAARDRLKALKGLWLDCGDIDQYNLLYGARRLHRLLETHGVPHVYEEFPDDHSGIDYRLEGVLPFLVAALSRD